MPANDFLKNRNKTAPKANNNKDDSHAGLSNAQTSEPVRLQVFLAHSGVASRRASEQIILDGRVSVNGQVVTELGTKVTAADEIAVDGKKINLEEKKRYVLLNKPAGFVCSLSDEKGRSVAADLLKEKYSERLYNVGRLDMYSKGAILFTNDGDFVETSQDVSQETAKLFEHGLRVDNVFYKCLHCDVLKARKIRIVLIEGKNREIRNMLESQNIGTKSLVRVRIGCVNLDDLKPGESRDLTSAEIKGLLSD